MFGFVTSRRHAAELAGAAVEANRQREPRLKAEEIARTEVAARRAITAQYCALSDEHDQALARNQNLCAQLGEARDAAGIEAKARQEAAEDKHRADRLQQRLDEAVGLDATTIRSSAPWQPGYKPQPEKKVTTP